MCRNEEIRADVPFARLPRREQDLIINGDPDYGKDADHEWPRTWYGVKGYFRWLESKAYKMHVRVLLSRYRAYSPCPECQGKRLKPDALLYRVEVPSCLGESDVAAGILNAREPCARASGTPSANAPMWKTQGANPGSRVPPTTTSETGEPPAAATGKETIELSLADFYSLTVDHALALIDHLTAARFCAPSDPIALVLGEVHSRLCYLADVGLGYLTLDRPTRTLSGGETERVNLTTCLGTRLVNTLFVLDEPSVGLHTRDTARLVRILESLRDTGNTVIVVEHEACVIRAADQIVDLGPGSGEAGGHVIFQGPFKRILSCRKSLTGQYLSGRKQIELPTRRPTKPGQAPSLPGSSARTGWRSESLALHDAPVPLLGRRDVCPTLKITGASRHNLKNLSIEIPLNRFVAVTGVSGSGKTTFVREVLHPLLEAKLREAAVRSVGADDEAEELLPEAASTSAQLYGSDPLRDVVLVDQSPLGRTPRSNPAVYVGAFDDIRELFARTELARQRGLGPSAFSFNSTQGQCETCRGAGFEKIEMQFLSDVYIRCPACGGRRYRPHILEVKISCPLSVISGKRRGQIKTAHGRLLTAEKIWSIADLLEATVDETIAFLDAFSDAPPTRRAVTSLRLLQEVGLGYLRLGQPINTLSGGESQRLKLVRHLAEFAQSTHTSSKPTLFLFDEPTTGLHFDDVRVLLKVFQRLVDGGHSLIVIEHNLDVIKCADWILDLGPEAGDQGGYIVAQGTPEEIAACEESHTGRALRELLGITTSRISRRPPTPEYATYA
jgi:excinuclease ABC subunit A